MMNNIEIIQKRSYTLPNREYPRPFQESKGNIHDLLVGDIFISGITKFDSLTNFIRIEV